VPVAARSGTFGYLWLPQGFTLAFEVSVQPVERVRSETEGGALPADRAQGSEVG